MVVVVPGIECVTFWDVAQLVIRPDSDSVIIGSRIRIFMLTSVLLLEKFRGNGYRYNANPTAS
jgi:hypothetical protein